LQAAFVQQIKDSLKLQHLMVAAPQLTLRQHLEGSKSQGGEPQEIHNVAVCAGSGSGLLDAALAANADTFVTGTSRAAQHSTVNN
jgi:putative NIF3 family GTP cyclohydrolase 1 type 2